MLHPLPLRGDDGSVIDRGTPGGSAVGAYLRTRRQLVQPEAVGLVREPGRRVPGLRREEVASLAGISPEYYLRLERGKDRHPSEQVVRALAAALRLDGVATAYLARLAAPERRHAARDASPAGRQLDGIVPLIDQWRDVPAYVTDANLDIVLSNGLAGRIGGGAMSPGGNRALAMFAPTMRASVPDWAARAREISAALRFQGDPREPRHRELVQVLAARHSEFRETWDRHDVHRFTSGDCFVPVDGFGTVRFRWQNLEVPGPGHYTLTTMFAEPGSRAAGVLAFVAARRRSGSDAAVDGEELLERER